jgi:uncharacterized membrane protein
VSPFKRAALVVLAVGMVAIGVDHWVNPEPFERIMPASLPWPHGVFEVLGGVGVAVPHTRRFAAWGLVALYVAVFPANVNMAWNHVQLTPDGTLPVWAMWLRLPFQALFVAWAGWFTRREA